MQDFALSVHLKEMLMKKAYEEKSSVCAGLYGNGKILGPFFYDRNLTGDLYLRMLNRTIIPSLELACNANQLRNWRMIEQWFGEHRSLWWLELILVFEGTTVVVKDTRFVLKVIYCYVARSKIVIKKMNRYFNNSSLQLTF